MEAFETFEHAGMTCELHYDTDAESPADGFDTVGTFGHWHRDYILGDENIRGAPWLERAGSTRFGLAYAVRYLELAEHAVAVVPVGMIDHSGITVYAGGGAHWCDPGGWDSGTVGLYWITRDEAEREGWTPEDAERYIRGQIQTWATYLEGGVVGYVVEDEDGDHVDSCWGFYPDESSAKDPDGLEYVRDEARTAAEWEREQRTKAAALESAECERCARQDIATVQA